MVPYCPTSTTLQPNPCSSTHGTCLRIVGWGYIVFDQIYQSLNRLRLFVLGWLSLAGEDFPQFDLSESLLEAVEAFVIKVRLIELTVLVPCFDDGPQQPVLLAYSK